MSQAGAQDLLNLISQIKPNLIYQSRSTDQRPAAESQPNLSEANGLSILREKLQEIFLKTRT